MTARGPLA